MKSLYFEGARRCRERLRLGTLEWKSGALTCEGIAWKFWSGLGNGFGGGLKGRHGVSFCGVDSDFGLLMQRHEIRDCSHTCKRACPQGRGCQL